MSAELPSGRAGSALAVALLAGLLFAAWFAGAAPLLARHAERAEALAQRQALLRRLEALDATLPALRDAAAAAAGMDAAGGAGAAGAAALLEGATDAVAGAALQELVRGMAARAGATLFSVETLPAEPSGGGHRRIGLRLSLAAPWPVLARLLQAIEQARPGMAIDDLDVRQSPFRAGEEDAPLDAALTVYAFRGSAEARKAP